MSSPRYGTPLIGVFDSGLGGLSVLKALHQQSASTPLLYVADSGHAPYGERDLAHVVDRSLKITRHLVEQGARTVVVACNTATAAAIDTLRQHFSGLVLVGVEPGIKPAAALSENKRIGVMATPSTLASKRFATLIERYAPACEVLRVPCPGLVAAIEQGDAAKADIESLLDRFCQPLMASRSDTVVLGCTHYPFVREAIARRLGSQVQLLDTSDAVARHALALHGATAATGEPPLRLQTTGDPQVLERFARTRLGLNASIETLSL